MNGLVRWLPVLPLLLVAACDTRVQPAPSAPPPPAAAAEDSGLPATAQPRLRTLKLWLGQHELTAEVALTADQIRTGMMFRTNMAENEGMLFVFAGAHQASFWMKNVPIPLSCAYIDPEGLILELRDMEPQDPTPLMARSDRVQFVLETARGWFDRHGIRTGMLIRTEAGSLAETFFRRRPASR